MMPKTVYSATQYDLNNTTLNSSYPWNVSSNKPPCYGEATKKNTQHSLLENNLDDQHVDGSGSNARFEIQSGLNHSVLNIDMLG